MRHGFKFIDLFSGLGGFHLALQSCGGTGVFAAEWEPTLSDLYEKNFGLRPWVDVAQLNDPGRQVPDHDLLAAGFPCQPFSKAGEQLGFEHTQQGQLFFKVLEILETKRPPKFILENVPNILRHRNGTTLRTILGHLTGLGYEVDVQRLSPHQFGIPQIRERAYFVGSITGLQGFSWPAPCSCISDIRHVLDSHAIPVRPVPKLTLRAIDVWGDFLRSSPPSVKLPSFPIWAMEFGATYPFEEITPAVIQANRGTRALARYKGTLGASLTGRTAQEQLRLLPSHSRRLENRFPRWKVRFIRQNRQFFDENRSWIVPWMERSDLGNFHSSLQKFEWNVQGGERDISKYVLQVRASGLRVKRTNTAPSLVAMTHTQVPILGWDRRYMTPEECAKLQSLDGIALPADDLTAYKALGNAVNASVVRKIAEPLLASD
ncbi:DNA (cytosine-5-)-methyltransferase [Jatrophihabitans fulvus]